MRPNTPYTGPADTASTYDQLNNPGRVTCTSTHNVGAAVGGTGPVRHQGRLLPHHEPFQYYASTANPHHLAPTSLAASGRTRPPRASSTRPTTSTTCRTSTAGQRHQQRHAAGQPPTGGVSYLKAPGYEDGHAGYSDPIDEQKFVVNEVNSLEQLPTWNSTAVVVAYDDSDGWYDHVYSGVTNPSADGGRRLTGPNQCGTGHDLPRQRAGSLRLRASPPA